MAYVSRNSNKKSFESANKANHTHVINDDEVKTYLSNCEFPKDMDEIDLAKDGILVDYEDPVDNPIKIIIAVDGGYTEVEPKKTFPTSKVAFFQFGAFWLNLEDWNALDNNPFIAPEDMASFNDLERIKLVLPIKHVNYKAEEGFVNSFRRTLYEFFMKVRDHDGSRYMDTLKWLLYEEFNSVKSKDRYSITSPDPKNDGSITLFKSEMKTDFTFDFDGFTVYLTDVFRFHESIDEELGAGGILGVLSTSVEQIIIAHFIKYIVKQKPDLLKSVLFIKDGGLAFFDRTARLHKSMRNLTNYLFSKYNIFLVGLEKSGPFTDHADEITRVIDDKSKMAHSKILLLSDKYIYKYITPGGENQKYGRTSYYGAKVIYKSKNGGVYVASFPVKDGDVLINPQKADFRNIDVILHNLDKLKCDMYENAIVPVTLANRLVSLANHPSQQLLEKFSVKTIKR